MCLSKVRVCHQEGTVDIFAQNLPIATAYFQAIKPPDFEAEIFVLLGAGQEKVASVLIQAAAKLYTSYSLTKLLELATEISDEAVLEVLSQRMSGV